MHSYAVQVPKHSQAAKTTAPFAHRKAGSMSKRLIGAKIYAQQKKTMGYSQQIMTMTILL